MLKYMETNCNVHIYFQHNQLKMLEILSHQKYLSVENKDFSGDEFHHCLKYIYFKKNILSQIPCLFFFFFGKKCKKSSQLPTTCKGN
jgi:hypothetical protein